MPVYYGDVALYVPEIGSLRQCREMKCTLSTRTATGATECATSR